MNSKGEVYTFGGSSSITGDAGPGLNIPKISLYHPVKMIRSKPVYMIAAPGKVGANSNDDYKYIYTNDHPNRQAVDEASPLIMTSQNISSPRYDSLSTITNDDYTTSNDYFNNYIGGEMCSEAGNCFEVPQIREPNEDLEALIIMRNTLTITMGFQRSTN